MAAYSFDEGSGAVVDDASGNNNTGTIVGASWTTGQYGSGLLFDGANDYLQVASSQTLNMTDEITIEAWISSPTGSGWDCIFSKGYYSEAYSLFLENGNEIGFYLAGNEIMTGATIPSNSLTHVALTYDGSQVIAYVNGLEVYSVTLTGPIATSPNPLYIGQMSAGDQFSGTIDEVRIYDRALTATEIQTDMNSPVGSPPPPSTPSLSINSLLRTSVGIAFTVLPPFHLYNMQKTT